MVESTTCSQVSMVSRCPIASIRTTTRTPCYKAMTSRDQSEHVTLNTDWVGYRRTAGALHPARQEGKNSREAGIQSKIQLAMTYQLLHAASHDAPLNTRCGTFLWHAIKPTAENCQLDASWCSQHHSQAHAHMPPVVTYWHTSLCNPAFSLACLAPWPWPSCCLMLPVLGTACSCACCFTRQSQPDIKLLLH